MWHNRLVTILRQVGSHILITGLWLISYTRMKDPWFPGNFWATFLSIKRRRNPIFLLHFVFIDSSDKILAIFPFWFIVSSLSSWKRIFPVKIWQDQKHCQIRMSSFKFDVRKTLTTAVKKLWKIYGKFLLAKIWVFSWTDYKSRILNGINCPTGWALMTTVILLTFCISMRCIKIMCFNTLHYTEELLLTAFFLDYNHIRL